MSDQGSRGPDPLDPGGAAPAATGDALRRALEARVEQLWRLAGVATESDAELPLWVHDLAVDQSRFAAVNRRSFRPDDTPDEPQSSAVTFESVNLTLARELEAADTPAAVAAAGLRLAAGIEALLDGAEPPGPSALVALMVTWLAVVPGRALDQDVAMDLVGIAVAAVGVAPNALPSCARLVDLLPHPDVPTRAVRWLGRKRLLDRLMAVEAPHSDETRQAAAAVAARLATETSIMRQIEGSPSDGAAFLIDRANVVSASWRPDPLDPASEDRLLLRSWVDVVGREMLVAWWGLRAGRWVIDHVRPRSEIVALDVVTAVASAALGDPVEATYELLRLLGDHAEVLAPRDRILVALVAVHLVLGPRVRIGDALASLQGMAALTELAAAYRAVPDPALDEVAGLVAALPSWRPLAGRPAAHVEEGLVALSGLVPSPAGEFDPGRFPTAVREAVADALDSDPDASAPDVLAHLAGRVRIGLEAREVVPEGLDLVTDLRLDASAVRELWPPDVMARLDHAVLGAQADGLLEEAELRLLRPPPAPTVIRRIAQRLGASVATRSEGEADGAPSVA